MTRSERDAWVAALRSGEYSQAHGMLRHGNGGDYSFCCLGVLAETSPRLRRDPAADDDGYGEYVFDGGERDTRWSCDLPSVVLARGLQSELIRMNDRGRSFAEIADWIEANVPVEEDAS